MDPNNEVNKNIASAYLEMLALEEKKKNEGLDPVNKDAVKKNFKDRKDKDIDNDGDEDESDEYLHNRRKTVSKAIDKDGEVDQDKPKVTSSDADSEKDNDDDRDEKGSVLKKDNDKKKTAEQTKESVELDEATDFKSTFDDLKKGDTVKIKYAGLFSSREKEETFKVTAKSIVSKFKIGKITLVKQGEGDTKDKYYLYDRNGEVSMSYDNMGAKGITRDHNMTRLVKESVDEENLKELGLEILDKMSEAKEGVIDRMLAGRNKEGSKKWVTKKPETKEFVEPSLLMKRILDEKRVGDAEQNIDTWDKQVSNRRADDVLDTEITEKEFMDMHNVDTPEFVDGPKVANKTMDAIKNSVKSKSATRNNDSTIGESVELNKKENDMNEGMTPMQRALAKVKAQSKDKVSVKKAPWDKDDVKKEDVDLESVNEMYIGQQWHRGHRRNDGIATNLNWYSDLHRLLKRLEDDMQDRKKRLGQELGGSSNSAYEKENSFAIIKGHIDPTIKAIADVKKTLKPVVKAWAKAYKEAKDADTAVDIIMRKTPAERGHK